MDHYVTAFSCTVINCEGNAQIHFTNRGRENELNTCTANSRHKERARKEKHSWMFVYYRMIQFCVPVGVVKLPRKTAIPDV